MSRRIPLEPVAGGYQTLTKIRRSGGACAGQQGSQPLISKELPLLVSRLGEAV